MGEISTRGGEDLSKSGGEILVSKIGCCRCHKSILIQQLIGHGSVGLEYILKSFTGCGTVLRYSLKNSLLLGTEKLLCLEIGIHIVSILDAHDLHH